MQKRLRFGIIGGGLMGREFVSAAARWCHLTDMQVRPEVVAVCDTRPEALEWFAEAAGVSRTTADYRELLADDDVDAVYCAVPHNLHERFYCDTIAAGKHLLGEKPFGIDLEANARIVAAAAERDDLVVRCCSEFPYFPGAQRIVEHIRAGRVGRVLEAEVGFLHCSDMNPDKPLNWKRTISANGEYGCMGDLGLHILHVPLRVGWVPHNVRAILSNIFPQRPDGSGEPAACETWDNATLLCEVEREGGSFPLTAKTHRISPGETNTWYISVRGTRLSARFSTRRPRTLETMPYEPGGRQCWREEAIGYQSVYPTITGSIFEFGFGDALLQMIAAFCHQVLEGNGAEVPFGCGTLEETQWTHRIFTAALRSHARREVVGV